MTFGDLLELLERRRAEAAQLGTLVPEEKLLDYVLAQLRALQDGPARSPRPPASTSEDDRLLSAEDVADRMGCSKGYVYAHADEFPFTRRLSGNVVRFSAAGLAHWMAQGNGDR